MTQTQTFRIEASYLPDGTPQRLTGNMQVETETVARELAAQFPKSLKVRGHGLSTYEGRPGTDSYRPYQAGSLSFTANLVANGVNGGVNETGLRRYRSLLRTLDRLGIETEWVAPYTNSFATQADFEEALQ